MQTWDGCWRFNSRDLSQSINHRLLKTSRMCTYIGWHSVSKSSVSDWWCFVLRKTFISMLFFYSLWRFTLIPFNDIDHIWGLYLLRSMIEKCAAFKIKSSPNEARSLWHATSPRPSFILKPSIEVSITCHLLLLLAHEPSCKCCI